MHKKLLKGIAAVMSAALVLGSVVTGVVPANAAVTSVQAESGLYETTYNMGDLNIANGGYSANATVDGTSVVIDFTGEYGYGGKYFEIPKAVLEAGFKGAKIKLAEPTDKIGMKCAGDHDLGDKWSILVVSSGTEITADPAQIGDDVSGTSYESYEGQRTEEHLKYITAFGVIQPGNDSFSIVVETVTFITDNAVGEAEEPVKPVENTVTYALTDLEYAGQAGDNVSVEGTTITLPDIWNQVYYVIPEKVLNAGLLACEVSSSADSHGYTMLFSYKDDSGIHEICRNYHSNKVTITDLGDNATEDDLQKIALIGFMKQVEDAANEIPVDSITFTTTNPVDGAVVDPGTDPTPAKPGKVKITKATPTKNSVKLTWKKVKNCTDYEVYRSTSKNGEYKLIKTVKKATFTNKKLKANTQYFYKVKAVNKTTGAEGALSAAKKVTTKK